MLSFALLTKAGTFRRQLVPASAHLELLWNEVSFAELTFEDNDSVWDIIEPGDRVDVFVDGVWRMRGPWLKQSANSESMERTLYVVDDMFMFALFGWPAPAAAITAQPLRRRYTGPTETVVKDACSELSTRLGLGWTIPASTGLGATRRVDFRFHPLLDKLLGRVKADRLTWSLRKGVVGVVKHDTFDRTLTLGSGVIGRYEWSLEAPTATSVIVGGEGEGAAQVLRRYTDTDAEALWGFRRELFVSANQADGVTDLSDDGLTALAENAGTVTLAAELIENDWFRYGKYVVGSLVNVQIGAIERTEVIRSVVIDEARSGETTVVPSIGEFTADAESRLARQVVSLQRTVRDLRRK